MENKHAAQPCILQLQNIGKIKHAELDINGLCVLAGKNNEGKSSVGKAIMAIIKAANITKHKGGNLDIHFFKLADLLFDGDITTNGEGSIALGNQKNSVKIKITNNSANSANPASPNARFLDCTIIQTPFVWDLYEFFSSIETLSVEDKLYGGNFDFKYPYIWWDLYKKLKIRRPHATSDFSTLIESITEVMGGSFIKSDGGLYEFVHANNAGGIRKTPLKNTAQGIKSFATLELLLRNNYFTPAGFFVFDEPESHLHPSWQVKFAEILVQLIKTGICMLVCTHSPYMLEALHKYAKKEGIKNVFYLLDNGEVRHFKNNESALEQIYMKFNEPFAVFDDLQEQNNGF